MATGSFSASAMYDSSGGCPARLEYVSRWMLVFHSQLVVSGCPVPTYLAWRRSSSCWLRSLSACWGERGLLLAHGFGVIGMGRRERTIVLAVAATAVVVFGAGRQMSHENRDEMQPEFEAGWSAWFLDAPRSAKPKPRASKTHRPALALQVLGEPGQGEDWFHELLEEH